MRKTRRLFRGFLGVLLSLGLLVAASPLAYASGDESSTLIGFYAEEIFDFDTVLAVFLAEGCNPTNGVSGTTITDNIHYIYYNDSEDRILEVSSNLTECDNQLIDPETQGLLTAPGFTGVGMVGVFNFSSRRDLSAIQILGLENPDQVGVAAPPNLLASPTSSFLSASNLQSDVTGRDGSFPFFIVSEDGDKTTFGDSPWESFGVLANPASVPATVTLNVFQRGERFLNDFHHTLTPHDIFIFTVDETLSKTLAAPFLFTPVVGFPTDIVAVDVRCDNACNPNGNNPTAGILGWGFNMQVDSGQMMQYNMAQDTNDTEELEDDGGMTIGF
jgi:hypothetical protein